MGSQNLLSFASSLSFMRDAPLFKKEYYNLEEKATAWLLRMKCLSLSTNTEGSESWKREAPQVALPANCTGNPGMEFFSHQPCC